MPAPHSHLENWKPVWDKLSLFLLMERQRHSWNIYKCHINPKMKLVQIHGEEIAVASL